VKDCRSQRLIGLGSRSAMARYSEGGRSTEDGVEHRGKVESEDDDGAGCCDSI